MTKPAPTILTREDLHAGTGVRISIPKLGVFEGPIEKPDDQYRRGYPDSIMVAGVRLNPASHDVEFVADADLTPGRPAVLEPTAEQVIKAVEDDRQGQSRQPVHSHPRLLRTALRRRALRLRHRSGTRTSSRCPGGETRRSSNRAAPHPSDRYGCCTSPGRNRDGTCSAACRGRQLESF